LAPVSLTYKDYSSDLSLNSNFSFDRNVIADSGLSVAE
jgi:hypothetical protein